MLTNAAEQYKILSTLLLRLSALKPHSVTMFSSSLATLYGSPFFCFLLRQNDLSLANKFGNGGCATLF